MTFLRFFSPLRAWRDLRFFLARRRPHQIGFMFAAMAVTLIVILGFVHDSRFTKEYHRNIIYFQSWPLSRTLEQVRAQQKIDAVEQQKRQAEIEKKQRERQESFKRLNDAVHPWL